MFISEACPDLLRWIVRLPFAPPLAPMLSRAADALPDGDGWQFEPKWDGFRTIVFRDGNEVVQATDGRPTDSWVKSG
jgi:ATP-dependent DNA ligase